LILGYNPPFGAKFFALILPYLLLLGISPRPFRSAPLRLESSSPAH